MEISSFPKIWHVGHRNVTNLFLDEVEITEKVDGFQFIVGKDPEGNLRMRSKGVAINQDAPPNIFRPVVEYFLEIQDRIPDDIVFYGETLCKPRHNTLQYDSVPKNHFAMFGVSDFSQFEFKDYDTMVKTAELMDVDVVPLIFKGKIDQGEILKLIGRKSFLGGVNIEGVVAKLYSPTIQYGKHLGVQSAKYVSEEFKEQHHKNSDWKPSKGKMTELFELYHTEARFNKAVQYLRDSDKLLGEPKDIGALMKRLNEDLAEECQEEIMHALWAIHRKEFIKVATRGFAQWYKEQLVKGNVND